MKDVVAIRRRVRTAPLVRAEKYLYGCFEHGIVRCKGGLLHMTCAARPNQAFAVRRDGVQQWQQRRNRSMVSAFSVSTKRLQNRLAAASKRWELPPTT